MRKRSVDAYKVLEQLRKCLTASVIAEEQGVTRQAINVWRKKFIEQGILEKPKRGRPHRGIAGVSNTKVEGLISRQFEKLSVQLHQRISELEAKNEEIQGRIRTLERERELEEELNKRKRELEMKERAFQLRLESEHQGSPA